MISRLPRLPLRPLLAAVVPSRGRATWSVELEPHHALKFKKPEEIVNAPLIRQMLKDTEEKAKDIEQVRAILAKAEDHALLKHVKGELDDEYVQGLTLEETAVLLNTDSTNEPLMQELFSTALRIKQRIYGNRIVLFAPLYLANYCVNNCTYCGFRHDNKGIDRALLTDNDIVEEVKSLQRAGHRRVLMLTGESPKYSFDKFLDALKLVASVETEPHGKIRRINVEIPTLSVSDFRRLEATGVVGTFTLFQETYDPDVYNDFHLDGPKSDYTYRLHTMDRAMAAGIGDVGIGALFGLTDYRFEVMGLLMHANHLNNEWGTGPHTISIPRIRPAAGTPLSREVPYPVADLDFRKLVAILRCSVPYTGMILSTRESPEMRNELVNMGISQMSAGSHTAVGAYSKYDNEEEEDPGQFSLQDCRSLDHVVGDLIDSGFTPSWCTACYRVGRTGKKFMKIAKEGKINNYCQPNAFITLQEYMEDYASDSTKKAAEKLIDKDRVMIPKKKIREKMDERLKRVKDGERDFFF